MFLVYMFSTACITAYRSDRPAKENMRLMRSLRNDLLCITDNITYCPGQWDGFCRPVYMVELGYMRCMDYWIRLSRKYGQNTLLYRGDIYDVATGKVIGHVTRESGWSGKTKPTHPRWIYLGDNRYCMLDTSVSLSMLDTLATWSSGHIAPLTGSVD
jgi:hypothetical protein